MRRQIVLALALAFAVGCRETLDPVDGTPFEGAYQLTTIDGNALPVALSIDGEAAPVTAGELSFIVPGFMTVNLTLGPSGESSSRAVALAGPYRRVTADSIVLPSIAPAELFVRRTGNSIVLVTQPAGEGVGPARRLGGAHRFMFVRAP